MEAIVTFHAQISLIYFIDKEFCKATTRGYSSIRGPVIELLNSCFFRVKHACIRMHNELSPSSLRNRQGRGQSYIFALESLSKALRITGFIFSGTLSSPVSRNPLIISETASSSLKPLAIRYSTSSLFILPMLAS